MDNLFFIISKLAWGMLSPGNILIIMVILVAVLLITNKIQLARILSACLALAGGVLIAYPVGDYLMYPLEQRFPAPDSLPEQVDGIIVLGGGIDLKRSVDWSHPETGEGADRYIAAAILAKRYPTVPVLFSGGSGLLRFQTLATEGQYARELLMALGVASSRLLIESKARNTYENMMRLRPLLPVKEGHYLLITSAFHMPRAVGIARKLGLQVLPYPVDYRSNRPELRQWDFNFSEHLQVLEPAWREWIGLTAYYWTGKTDAWFPAHTTAIR